MTRITKSPLDLTRLCRATASPAHGACTTFLGVVRAVHAGRKVNAVSYDCFVPLAEKELARIVAKAKRRFPAAIAVEHRIGRLRVGQASVAIAAASAHRAEAFEACRFAASRVRLSSSSNLRKPSNFNTLPVTRKSYE